MMMEAAMYYGTKPAGAFKTRVDAHNAGARNAQAHNANSMVVLPPMQPHFRMDSNHDSRPLPYWQVNVPPEEREEECPEALRNLSDKDMGIIGTRDEDYRVQAWDEVVDIIRTSRLADFRRWPTDLRRYRQYIWWLQNQYGSVMNFMLKERLQWSEPIVPQSTKPFECEDDFKILMNDWPYGLDKRIIHLVVWTKFDLNDTAEAEAEIEQFVQKTFSTGVKRDKVSGHSLWVTDFVSITLTWECRLCGSKIHPF